MYFLFHTWAIVTFRLLEYWDGLMDCYKVKVTHELVSLTRFSFTLSLSGYSTFKDYTLPQMSSGWEYVKHDESTLSAVGETVVIKYT